jgi:hypothetical protein
MEMKFFKQLFCFHVWDDRDPRILFKTPLWRIGRKWWMCVKCEKFKAEEQEWFPISGIDGL